MHGNISSLDTFIYYWYKVEIIVMDGSTFIHTELGETLRRRISNAENYIS